MPEQDGDDRRRNTQGTVGPEVPVQPGTPHEHTRRQDASSQTTPQAPPQEPSGQQPYGQQQPRQQQPQQQPYQQQRQPRGQQQTYNQQQPQQQQQPYRQQRYTEQPDGEPPSGQVPYYQLSRRGQLVVPQDETKLTGRRVVQYAIDYVLAGIIPGLAYWLFDRGNGSVRGFGWLIATVIALAVYYLYWVVIPYGHRGQSFGMRLLRIHVVSKDGGKASMAQLFIRGIFLIVDTLLFGLVGFVAILASRHRQRLGDHAAGTVVVRATYGSQVLSSRPAPFSPRAWSSAGSSSRGSSAG